MAIRIEDHHNQIREQFAKQAEGYTALASHSEELDRLIKLARPGSNHTVLDVACGSGIVSLAFAKYVSSVTGIDITNEMLDQAVRLQTRQRQSNVQFLNADVNALPFENNSFDIVVSRFSFHHMLDPEHVLSEMIRVCKPGGMVIVADVALPEDKVDHYNEMELLRDSSHVAALSVDAFNELFNSSGLKEIEYDKYLMGINLEDQLRSSFPKDKEQLRQMIVDDIGIDSLGIDATQINGDVKMYYPIYILAGRK